MEALKKRVCYRCWKKKFIGEFHVLANGQYSLACEVCWAATAKKIDDDAESEFIMQWYHQLMEAGREGRLHPAYCRVFGVEAGRHICEKCGMRHYTEHDARICCSELGWASDKKKSKPESVVGARVINGQALAGAIHGLKIERGHDNITDLARDIGINKETFRKIAKGKPAYLYRATYASLIRFFPRGIPGVQGPPVDSLL